MFKKRIIRIGQIENEISTSLRLDYIGLGPFCKRVFSLSPFNISIRIIYH